MMQNKLPGKHLIAQSGRLMLLFTLTSLVVGAMNESDLKVIFYKSVNALLLFVCTFLANTAIIVWFDRRRKDRLEKIGRKVFITGYLATLIIFFLMSLVNSVLERQGVLVPPPSMKTSNITGWRLYIFLPAVALLIYTFIFLIQNFIVHQYEKSKIELELLQLKAANTETVNQLLRQQIQPHFLFNALNVLKSLIKKYPQTAEAYLLRLSDFLRASITRNTSGLATLRDELKLCDDYMEMQRIRFGDALNYKVEVNTHADYMNKQLPFFALQPLLENAIKHNELTHLHPLLITIKKNGDYIEVTNNLQKKKMAEASTGNGLANLKERYSMLSEDKIIINEDAGQFSVSVKLL